MNSRISVLVIVLLAGLISQSAQQGEEATIAAPPAPTEAEATQPPPAPATEEPTTAEPTTAAAEEVETTAQAAPTTAQEEVEETTTQPTTVAPAVTEAAEETSTEATPAETTTKESPSTAEQEIPPPENMMEGTNTTEAMNETGTTTAPPQSTTTVSSTVQPKGVTTACLELYHNCTSERAQDEMNKKMYCDALKLAQPCISKTTGNETSECSTTELAKLVQLDCGPVELFNQTGKACNARVTECLSLAPGVQELNENYKFGQFFCDLADNSRACFLSKQNGSVCTDDEVKSMLEQAQCSSAQLLVPGVLLMALTFLVQNFLSRE